ncbi:MAG TPA: AarF/ABC1/UbiB kinase family protein [Deltaproteobacteria bacterium]|nr:AarF/ABC1/UbiB kinase family protein [Deltaproteobacteria bacterium]
MSDERKRDKLKQITSSWASRTLASGRVALRLSSAAGRRVVRAAGEASDAHLGTSIADDLDAMKGLAMKAGQMASYLEGSMPPEAQRMLRRLQQGGEPLELATLRPVVEDSLGATLEALFEDFDPEPLASASIAQVHRATFEGRDVVVKIQYPHIAETFEVDLGHLRRIGALAWFGSAMQAGELVGELRDRLAEECDFEVEANNQRRFQALWAGAPWVQIPEVIEARSSSVVLTSTFAEGQSFYPFIEAADAGARNLAGERLFSFAFGSIFGHGCLHGDPHPGNYLFPEHGEQVVFLDFGCVRWFDAEFVQTWKRLARVVLEGRRADLADVMVDTGMVPDPDRYDFDYHWQVMRYLYEPFLTPRFRYTHDYVKRSWSLLAWDNPNLRRTRMPRPWVLTSRLQWGLNSVLALLGAEADFGTLFREALQTPLVIMPR